MRVATLLIVFLTSTLTASCSGGSGNPNDSVDFTVAGQLENEFLAITVVFTATDATPSSSQLVRGKQKANSATADLKVTPSASGVAVGVYYMRDPRYYRIEGHEWRAADKAETIVFVPLSHVIDNLVIKPVPGREAFVSAGTTFDPRTWAIDACDRPAGATYSQCPDVLALVTSGAVVYPP